MATVLVVDDSEVERRFIGTCVSLGVDATVIYAADGVEALQQVEQFVPDLVVTDLQMPNMSGLELLTQIKEDYPQLPVILVTARGSEAIAAEALQLGAASYVPKLDIANNLPRAIMQVLLAAKGDQGHSMLMHCLDRDHCSFTIYNDLELIKTLVSHFQQMLRCLPLGDETERLRVSIAFHEALRNAYYHGNLEIGNSVQRGEQAVFAKLVAERQDTPPYCDRKIRVSIEIDRESVCCTVKDDGPGFDALRLARKLSAESAESGGRGIILMHTIMDEVIYNDAGNEIKLIKRKVSPYDSE